ncbi:hypothetical protein ACLB2K_050254 [Fragaria x ananassa]
MAKSGRYGDNVALTGGTLTAITGAAHAIAPGLSTLAPILSGIIPAIGATGFAAAKVSVTGSLAVAASFGAAGAGLTGIKMLEELATLKNLSSKQLKELITMGG